MRGGLPPEKRGGGVGVGGLPDSRPAPCPSAGRPEGSLRPGRAYGHWNPFQYLVYQGRRHQAPAASQHSRLPGGIQQLAMNPRRRQPCHDLHYPGAYAGPVGSLGRLQGQQHGPCQAERVRLSIVPDQGSVGWYRLQPVQIPRVSAALLAVSYLYTRYRDVLRQYL